MKIKVPYSLSTISQCVVIIPRRFSIYKAMEAAAGARVPAPAGTAAGLPGVFTLGVCLSFGPPPPPTLHVSTKCLLKSYRGEQRGTYRRVGPLHRDAQGEEEQRHRELSQALTHLGRGRIKQASACVNTD